MDIQRQIDQIERELEIYQEAYNLSLKWASLGDEAAPAALFLTERMIKTLKRIIENLKEINND